MARSDSRSNSRKEQGNDKRKEQKRGPKKDGDFSKFYKKEPKSRTTVIKEDSEDRFSKKPGKKFDKKPKEVEVKPKSLYDSKGEMRLNKYLAHAGVASRRDADTLIESGTVKVNGQVVTEMGFKVKATDKVDFGGQRLKTETLRYVLLNKPKGFITTTEDPQERKTVMMLVEKACQERIYPVGRLDKNTSGLLLFTNDGDLAKKLTHPKHRVRKMYHAVLNKPVTKADLIKMVEGIELEDGIVQVDSAEYVINKDKSEVGVSLHSGKNRVVRRIFETLGYDVIKLDRVAFASLTKKDLPRGRYRHLTQKEIDYLRML